MPRERRPRCTSSRSCSALEERARGPRPGRRAARPRRSRRSTHRTSELAAIVIADDDRIDGRYLEVHQGVLSLLALQAPVAGDLRVVAALLHVIKHIERMGDQCVNIAKVLPLLGPRAARATTRSSSGILQMGRRRARRCARPKRSFAARDAELAQDLVRQDARDQPPQPRDLPAGDRGRRRTPTRASGR